MWCTNAMLDRFSEVSYALRLSCNSAETSLDVAWLLDLQAGAVHMLGQRPLPCLHVALGHKGSCHVHPRLHA